MSTQEKQKYPKQRFDHFCVIDFEATCWENNKEHTMEIIELPGVMIDAKTLQLNGEFHMYVKPAINPTLSEYCTNLTGITQQQVDDADDFIDVLQEFVEWITFADFAGMESSTMLFITCGDWDLKTMLPNQCALSNIPLPEMFHSWCNIKRMYNNAYSEKVRGIHAMKEITAGEYRVRGMKSLLNRLNLPLIGRQHSGIDDARNIAGAVIKMCQDGCIFEYTWPKRNIGDELIEGLKAIARGEGKRTVVEIEDVKAKDAAAKDANGDVC